MTGRKLLDPTMYTWNEIYDGHGKNIIQQEADFPTANGTTIQVRNN